jgi:hypothetical protein
MRSVAAKIQISDPISIAAYAAKYEMDEA